MALDSAFLDIAMSVAMEEGPRRQPITVDEFYRMAKVGLIAPDARVELIDGEIIEMAPIGPPHSAAVNRLNRLLVYAVGERAIVQCQCPVQMGDISSPQPDFALLAPREDFYCSQRVRERNTLLAIEVSDSSLHYDLHRKMALYARHAIPEYWVVDVQEEEIHRVHVFRKPTGKTYGETFFVDRKPLVLPVTSLPGVTVDLSTVFP
jgi:Uma2 family endonuclease